MKKKKTNTRSKQKLVVTRKECPGAPCGDCSADTTCSMKDTWPRYWFRLGRHHVSYMDDGWYYSTGGPDVNGPYQTAIEAMMETE